MKRTRRDVNRSGYARVISAKHNYENYWEPSSPPVAATPWISVDDPWHLPIDWSFYRNGGRETHRPAWEDMILRRIDAERKAARMRQEVEERERQDKLDAAAASREAAALRAVRARAGEEGAEAATRIRTRSARNSRGRFVRSWHAPRTPSGYPEGVEEREGES